MSTLSKSVPLVQLANVIRSKNSGPFEITFDLIFSSTENFQRVIRSGVLTKEKIAELYGTSPERIIELVYFEPALAIKFTMTREVASGAAGEKDTYGAQQHVPLLQIDIP